VNTAINAYGRVVEDLCENNNLTVQNTGFPTRLEEHTGNITCIDLVITSNTLSPHTECSGTTDTLGSDHYPIHTTFTTKPILTHTTKTPSWKLDDANWELYKHTLEKTIITNIPHRDTDTYNENITNTIINAANIAIPKTTNTSRKPNLVPWWTEECKVAVQDKKPQTPQI
jgi:hypothetical protein